MNNFFKKSIVGVMAATMIMASMSPLTASAATESADAPSISTTVSSNSKYKINKTSITLTKGYQYTLSVSGTKSSNITWSTGDSSIATVSSKGKVVGKSAGTTYVYAKTPNGDILSCKVKVVPTRITASSGSSIEMPEDSKKSITLTVKGDKNISYVTTDSDVATASWGSWKGNNITFTIKAHDEGVATIKIYNKSNNVAYKTFTVTVSNGETKITPATTVVNMSENSSSTLPIAFENTSGVGYYSDNPDVATMSRTYITTDRFTYADVRTGKSGVAHIRVYSLDNPDIYVIVTVNVKCDIPISPYVNYYNERTYNLAQPSSNNIVFRTENDQLAYWIEDGELKYMIVPETYRANSWEDVYCIPASEYNSIESYSNDNYYSYEFNLLNPSANKFYVSARENLIFWIDSKTHKVNYMIVPESKTTKYLAKYDDSYALDYQGNPIYTNYNYYKITTTSPDYIRDGDTVRAFSYNLTTYYILMPEDYDSAIVESLVSNLTKTYDYYTVYATIPVKTAETDNVITFKYKGELRYILVPDGYENSSVDKVKNDYYKSVSKPLNFDDYNK